MILYRRLITDGVILFLFLLTTALLLLTKSIFFGKVCLVFSLLVGLDLGRFAYYYVTGRWECLDGVCIRTGKGIRISKSSQVLIRAGTTEYVMHLRGRVKYESSMNLKIFIPKDSVYTSNGINHISSVLLIQSGQKNCNF